MPTALITGLIKTLAIYLILAICYLIFFLCMKKSNIISKPQLSSFIKHVLIIHSIYFIPIVLISMFNILGYHLVAIISAIIFIAVGYPISNLVLKHNKTKKD